MNIIIFGATGLIGKELVNQALLDGHQVKAFGRNVFVEDLPTNNKNLTLIQGALFNPKRWASSSALSAALPASRSMLPSV